MELFEFLEILPSKFIEIQGVREGLLGYQVLILVPYFLGFAGSQALPIESLSFAIGDVCSLQHRIYGPLGPSCFSYDPLCDPNLLVIDGCFPISNDQFYGDP